MRYKNVAAVIMGGGKGSRLSPLTKDRCKPAVPIGGRYRLIDIPISNCINSGIIKIFVLTQFNTSSLHRHIERTYRFDMFSEGFCAIRAAEQTTENTDWYQGTADAVRQNLRYVMASNPELVLILSGDQLYRMDFSELIAFHKDHDADVSICAHPVDRATAPEMGLLHVNDDLKVVEFVEKPRDPRVLDKMRTPLDALTKIGFTPEPGKEYMANMGIYLFKTEVLQKMLDDTHQVDFGKEVMPSNLARFNMFAFPFAGFWEDIGTIRAFYETNMMLTQPRPAFSFFDPKAPIYTRPRFLPPTKMFHCVVNNSLIAEGGYLEHCEIHRCLLSDRTVIRRGSVLRDVFMMGADEMEGPDEIAANRAAGIPDIGIGRDCFIENAIVDKGARIGAGVRIRPQTGVPDRDGDCYVIRDGITFIPRRAIVPPGTKI